KILHPIMPFITEELWQQLGHREVHGALIGQTWPDIAAIPVDTSVDDEMGWLVRLISDIRSARSEINVPSAAKLTMIVRDAAGGTAARLERHRAALERLGRIERIDVGGT